MKSQMETIADDMLNTLGFEASLELLDRLREGIVPPSKEVGEVDRHGNHTKETQTSIDEI